MKVCRNCGYSTEKDENFCQYCGTPLENEKPVEKEYAFAELEQESTTADDTFNNYYEQKESAAYQICQKCGTKYNASMIQCPNCGKVQNVLNQNNESTEKAGFIVGFIAIIASFFGVIGIIIGSIGMRMFSKSQKGVKLCKTAITIGTIVVISQIFIIISANIGFLYS